jgi:hypothetical protein
MSQRGITGTPTLLALTLLTAAFLSACSEADP